MATLNLNWNDPAHKLSAINVGNVEYSLYDKIGRETLSAALDAEADARELGDKDLYDIIESLSSDISVEISGYIDDLSATVNNHLQEAAADFSYLSDAIDDIAYDISSTNGILDRLSAAETDISAISSEVSSIKNEIKGGVNYIGHTASPTVLTDQLTGAVITLTTGQVTATAGDMVTQSNGQFNQEFIFDGTKWQKLGDPSELKAFAFVDEGTATFTPSLSGAITSEGLTVDFSNAGFTGTAKKPTGTVTIPAQSITASLDGTLTTLTTTFTGTEAQLTASTAAGTLSLTGYAQQDLILTGANTLQTINVPSLDVSTATNVKFENIDITGATAAVQFGNSDLSLGISEYENTEISLTGMTQGSVKITSVDPIESLSANYTPEGTISLPTLSINSTSCAGGTASVSNEVLSLSFNNVLSSVDNPGYTGDAMFTGKGTVLNATFAGQTISVSGTYEKATSISCKNVSLSSNVTIPKFTLADEFIGNGTATGTTITVNFTPSGKVVLPAYVPAGSLTINYTPAGTIGDIQYTPAGSTTVNVAASTNVALAMDNYTPEGNITGTQDISHNHEHTIGGTAQTVTVSPKTST